MWIYRNVFRRFNEIKGLRDNFSFVESKIKSVDNIQGETGILEKITEVVSKVSLKQLDVPCILYNMNGCYNSLKELLNHMIEKGLSDSERQKGIFFADGLMQIQEILENSVLNKMRKCERNSIWKLKN